MTKKKILQMADFFYSSDSADDVPLRLVCVTGRYTGFDLSRDDFITLFQILSKSHDLKSDLLKFREMKHEQE